MRELYLEKPGDLKMRESAPAPAPKDNEVKVKVIYGGICGSDLRVLRGTIPYATYPCRPGHEILGTVVEAGEKSSHKVGTKVVSFPNTYCGAPSTRCRCGQGACLLFWPLSRSNDQSPHDYEKWFEDFWGCGIIASLFCQGDPVDEIWEGLSKASCNKAFPLGGSKGGLRGLSPGGGCESHFRVIGGP